MQYSTQTLNLLAQFCSTKTIPLNDPFWKHEIVILDRELREGFAYALDPNYTRVHVTLHRQFLYSAPQSFNFRHLIILTSVEIRRLVKKYQANQQLRNKLSNQSHPNSSFSNAHKHKELSVSTVNYNEEEIHRLLALLRLTRHFFDYFLRQAPCNTRNAFMHHLKHKVPIYQQNIHSLDNEDENTEPRTGYSILESPLMSPDSCPSHVITIKNDDNDMYFNNILLNSDNTVSLSGIKDDGLKAIAVDNVADVILLYTVNLFHATYILSRSPTFVELQEEFIACICVLLSAQQCFMRFGTKSPLASDDFSESSCTSSPVVDHHHDVFISGFFTLTTSSTNPTSSSPKKLSPIILPLLSHRLNQSVSRAPSKLAFRLVHRLILLFSGDMNDSTVNIEEQQQLTDSPNTEGLTSHQNDIVDEPQLSPSKLLGKLKSSFKSLSSIIRTKPKLHHSSNKLRLVHRSALTLLWLSYQSFPEQMFVAAGSQYFHPFRLIISELQDKMDSNGAMHNSNAENAAHPQHLVINFDSLLESILGSLHTPLTCLFFFQLLALNKYFRAHLTMSSYFHDFILRLCSLLLTDPELDTHDTYMRINCLLVLSQEPACQQNLHQQVSQDCISSPLFNPLMAIHITSLQNTSTLSLRDYLLITLYELLHCNLIRLDSHEPLAWSNAIAVIINISGSVTDPSICSAESTEKICYPNSSPIPFHPYAAYLLTSLLRRCSKRIHLILQLNANSNDIEENLHLQLYSSYESIYHLVQISVEICLHFLLPENSPSYVSLLFYFLQINNSQPLEDLSLYASQRKIALFTDSENTEITVATTINQSVTSPADLQRSSLYRLVRLIEGMYYARHELNQNISLANLDNDIQTRKYYTQFESNIEYEQNLNEALNGRRQYYEAFEIQMDNNNENKLKPFLPHLERMHQQFTNIDDPLTSRGKYCYAEQENSEEYFAPILHAFAVQLHILSEDDDDEELNINNPNFSGSQEEESWDLPLVNYESMDDNIAQPLDSFHEYKQWDTKHRFHSQADDAFNLDDTETAEDSTM